LHDYFIVEPTIAAFISWVCKRPADDIAFKLIDKNYLHFGDLTVGIDLDEIRNYVPKIDEEITAFRNGRHILIEKQSELAGYCLGLVEISLFLEHRTIVRMARFHPPDFLFTENEPYEGVEAAARSSGGRSRIKDVVHGSDGKWLLLYNNTSISSCHLSVVERKSKSILWDMVKP
jgi:hypothetical protein